MLLYGLDLTCGTFAGAASRYLTLLRFMTKSLEMASHYLISPMCFRLPGNRLSREKCNHLMPVDEEGSLDENLAPLRMKRSLNEKNLYFA